MNNNFNNQGQYNNNGGYSNNNGNKQQGQNNNNNKQQQPEREKLKINLKDGCIPFEGEIKGMLIPTYDICKKINALFKQTFSDYSGCVILPNKFTGKLETFLSFIDNGGDGNGNTVKALTTLVRRDINNLTPEERIMNLNNRYKNKTYELTQDAKDVLEDFIYPAQGQKKIKWENVITEQTQGNMYGRQTIEVIIDSVEIGLILRKIYGDKVDGNKVDYSVTIQKPLINAMMMYNQEPTEFLLDIKQLDTNKVEKLFEKLGMLAPQSGGRLPIVRA